MARASSTITTENASDGSSTEAALVVTRLLLGTSRLFLWKRLHPAQKRPMYWLKLKTLCLCSCDSIYIYQSDENNLVGTLPSELQLLTNMREFLSAANQLRGTLPTELSSSWLALDSLDIEDNALTGNPWPTLWAFANLRRLHVSDNPSLDRSTFTGSANENATTTLSFSFSPQLQELWMGNTNFAGTLPTELGLLTALGTSCARVCCQKSLYVGERCVSLTHAPQKNDTESLYVFDNALTGTLPSQLGLLANLKGLLAHGNQLQGSIPTQLFGSDDDSSQTALPLVRLRLDDNQLSGSLSSSMAALAPSVRELRLDNNALTGPVPVELWQLNQLELLSLANNTLQGSIPDEAFVEFASLDTLDLTNNELSGSIPASLFAIPSIRLVYLSHNAFTGSIPSNYGAATQLRDLYLDHNELQGSIPSIAAGQLANLTEFLLQDNAISSTMPDSVCNLMDSAMLEDLWADCAAAAASTSSSSSSVIEVNCTCCTQCVFLATE
jgi:Leucine-rich repeat (LRR) protein